MAVLLGDFMRTVLFFDGGTTIKQGNEAIAIDIKPPQNSVACKSFYFSFMHLSLVEVNLI